jgi:hypothetical protein
LSISGHLMRLFVDLQRWDGPDLRELVLGRSLHPRLASIAIFGSPLDSSLKQVYIRHC